MIRKNLKKLSEHQQKSVKKSVKLTEAVQKFNYKDYTDKESLMNGLKESLEENVHHGYSRLTMNMLCEAVSYCDTIEEAKEILDQTAGVCPECGKNPCECKCEESCEDKPCDGTDCTEAPKEEPKLEERLDDFIEKLKELQPKLYKCQSVKEVQNFIDKEIPSKSKAKKALLYSLSTCKTLKDAFKIIVTVTLKGTDPSKVLSERKAILAESIKANKK